jgi:hypothetical protein
MFSSLRNIRKGRDWLMDAFGASYKQLDELIGLTEAKETITLLLQHNRLRER